VSNRAPGVFPGGMSKLEWNFFDRDAVTVAKDLLGTFLVRRVNGKNRIGRIVEVEAYVGPQDRASHSSKGLTRRNRSMFGPPGYAYVYLIYGMHHCVNVVTGSEGHGAAVLIRAVEPVLNIHERTSGPGLVCRAMQIDLRLDGCDLLGDRLFIASDEQTPEFSIARSHRIGVGYAGSWARRLLRFSIRNNPFVSRP
jgi:DNA-3-methyladenine glycosylase